MLELTAIDTTALILVPYPHSPSPLFLYAYMNSNQRVRLVPGKMQELDVYVLGGIYFKINFLSAYDIMYFMPFFPYDFKCRNILSRSCLIYIQEVL